MESWYFAYGSNLLRGRLNARLRRFAGSAQPPRIAQLIGYRFVFQHLPGERPAYANLVADPNGVVLGALYRFRAADFQALDRYESGYERRHVFVTDAHGEDLSAEAYFMRPQPAVRFGNPEPDYLAAIVNGATEHKLPPEYIDRILESAATNERRS